MKDDRLYLLHMRERCGRIERFVVAGKVYFFESEELQDAVIRNIEVIGEAAKRVSPECRNQLPGIDWKRICGMRDVLIHDYIGVDLEQVWNVVVNGIPALKDALEEFLAGDPPRPSDSHPAN